MMRSFIARYLKEKFSYTNTFFHGEPYLDIKDPSPDLRGRFDFIICAEVMEHVPPPIDMLLEIFVRCFGHAGCLYLASPTLTKLRPWSIFQSYTVLRFSGVVKNAIW